MTKPTKLLDRLPVWYRDMHAKGEFSGQTWMQCLPALKRFLPDVAERTILDYGCGPRGGLSENQCWKVIPYDPYVEKFAAPYHKERFSVFFSCDVFEHMTEWELLRLLRSLSKRSILRYIFLAISTRPATKLLPNGLNAHLTVRSSLWWDGLLRGTLGHCFETKLATADLQGDEAVFGLVRMEYHHDRPREDDSSAGPECVSGSP